MVTTACPFHCLVTWRIRTHISKRSNNGLVTFVAVHQQLVLPWIVSVSIWETAVWNFCQKGPIKIAKHLICPFHRICSFSPPFPTVTFSEHCQSPDAAAESWFVCFKILVYNTSFEPPNPMCLKCMGVGECHILSTPNLLIEQLQNANNPRRQESQHEAHRQPWYMPRMPAFAHHLLSTITT